MGGLGAAIRYTKFWNREGGCKRDEGNTEGIGYMYE